MQLLERLKAIEDPVKKRAFFIGILSEEFKKRGCPPPIIVGGMAVELYTQGSYTTGDIDIKAQKDLLEEILQEWGFVRKGRIWFNEGLDIYIDWLGNTLDEGKEAEERVNTLIIGEGLEIKVISIEDLIIDRLNAFKWWNDEDSLIWAKALYRIKEAIDESIDRDYLKKRALQEGIADVLERVLE